MSLALSVVIPTFNESQNIASCIQSVENLATEILVLDNFSQDGTPEIARSLNAQVHQRAFDNFSANKNAAIELASNDWILILDADERLTAALRNEIQSTLNSPAGADAFRIKRDAYFCGKKVRCWSGRSVIRLFHKGKAAYDSAKLVHEELVVNGRIGSLQHPMEHYTFRSLEQYLPKVHSFTSLAAREAYQKGTRASWFGLFLYPTFRFLKTYFVKGGILDGIPGLIIAWLAAYTVFLKMAKLWELQNSHE
jgi:glycosyltransferase involved in cell wall biosynthesis